MSRPSRQLVTGIEFMDALSGDFSEPQPGTRKHTLGRLAMATFKRGSRSDHRTRESFRYSPSWAIQIDAHVDAYALDDNGLYRMKGIMLVDSSERSLFVQDNRGDDFKTVVISTPTVEATLPLDLKYLPDTQNTIARLTEQFFAESVQLEV